MPDVNVPMAHIFLCLDQLFLTFFQFVNHPVERVKQGEQLFRMRDIFINRENPPLLFSPLLAASGLRARS